VASPPFDINASLPEDDDVVSQFPLNERNTRDIIESWFLVEGNVNGRSDKRLFDWKADPSGVASTTTVWADTAGTLKYRVGTGSIDRLIGPPAGTVAFFAGTTEPIGWLFAYGQAVSRTTYADLFAVIGTTYGAGNGSTTFNLPDLQGRVIAAKDNMSGTSANRLTGLTEGVNGDTLGATGGLETQTLSTTQIPAHLHAQTAQQPTFTWSQNELNDTGGGANLVSSIQASGGANSITTTGDLTPGDTANTGGGLAHNNVQPTIILNGMIRY
jgi:microcystin-dependent protein